MSFLWFTTFYSGVFALVITTAFIIFLFGIAYKAVLFMFRMMKGKNNHDINRYGDNYYF